MTIKAVVNRLRFALGVAPLSERWGDRGQPLHRAYVDAFLQQHAKDIAGHCLEFQEDTYTSRFGGKAVTRLDILHKEPGNPCATIVSDLTKPNALASKLFDCIICTYVLHVVFDFETMLEELRRLLKPEGVLLMAVPCITVDYPHYHELWRFTSEGLATVLGRVFGEDHVSVTGYGNSLTSAGELRGLVARDFTNGELAHHDPCFAMVVMGRAVKQ